MNLNIEQEVRKIIVTQLDINEDEVHLHATFADDLGADSLDVVELMMAMEERFGVEIPDEDAEKLKTVQDAIQYIEKHMNK
jgi:acyl carrier protein